MATLRSWRTRLSFGPLHAAVEGALGAAVILGALALDSGAILRADQRVQAPRQALDPKKEGVTPVTGPSWLKRLGLRGPDSSLGRGAGIYGPGAQPQPGSGGAIHLPVESGVALTGADIYRLNCQACHRAEGTGAPPEIKSVLKAVEGTSLSAVRQQLKTHGKDPSGAAAGAAGMREDLYQRIHKGGQRMPPLAHLQRADFDLLYGYLAELAHSSDANTGRPRTVSLVRLGEHVVKGTCHICHDAAGPRPSNRELLAGAIPPLSGFLKDRTVVDFVRKARRGGPIVMGEPPFPHRGRMPVFHYLKDEEVAAGYMFLVAYPPQASSASR